ncbi:MAG: molybdopterin-dependent oxidoreductase, partial [Nitrosomonas sp.]|nr:molybdopterin-dependent oxidoreductase [Nitrosomonas sp.]
GNLSQHHPDYSRINLLASLIAQITGASYGILGEAANSVGAYLVGAIPEINALSVPTQFDQAESGLNAAQMLGYSNELTDEKCQAFILMNVEPEFDSYDSQKALKTIKSSEFVVSLSAYKGNAGDYADILLPIAPFTETSGTYVNTEGRIQSFNGVVSPLGEARPAWKVLRVLANLLELEKFEYETPEQIRAEIFPEGIEINRYLDNSLRDFGTEIRVTEGHGIQRIGEVPIYQTDPIVRRAESLQATQDAVPPKAWMTTAMLDNLGVISGDQVKITQGDESVRLEVAHDDKLPDKCVRVASSHPKTLALGALFGVIQVEKQ